MFTLFTSLYIHPPFSLCSFIPYLPITTSISLFPLPSWPWCKNMNPSPMSLLLLPRHYFHLLQTQNFNFSPPNHNTPPSFSCHWLYSNDPATFKAVRLLNQKPFENWRVEVDTGKLVTDLKGIQASYSDRLHQEKLDENSNGQSAMRRWLECWIIKVRANPTRWACNWHFQFGIWKPPTSSQQRHIYLFQNLESQRVLHIASGQKHCSTSSERNPLSSQ